MVELKFGVVDDVWRATPHTKFGLRRIRGWAGRSGENVRSRTFFLMLVWDSFMHFFVLVHFAVLFVVRNGYVIRLRKNDEHVTTIKNTHKSAGDDDEN